MTKIITFLIKTKKIFFNLMMGGIFERFLKKIKIYYMLKKIYDTIQTFFFQIEGTRPEYIQKIQFEKFKAQFKVSSGPERQSFSTPSVGANNEKTMSILLNTLSIKDIFWDIGANVGLYSCFAGQIVEEGNLVCIEPIPVNLARLKQNLTLNNISKPLLLNYALSNEEGTFGFEKRDNLEGGLGSLTHETSKIEDTVRVIPGDKLISKKIAPPPTVIKMDIAGEEWHVIQGMAKALSNENCKLLLCEIHPRGVKKHGGTVDDFIEKVHDLGFSKIKQLKRSSAARALHYSFKKSS